MQNIRVHRMSTSQKISWCLSLGRHEKNEKKWYHSPLGLTLKDNSSHIFLGCSGFVSILFVEFQCQCLYATIVGKNFLRFMVFGLLEKIHFSVKTLLHPQGMYSLKFFLSCSGNIHRFLENFSLPKQKGVKKTILFA